MMREKTTFHDLDDSFIHFSFTERLSVNSRTKSLIDNDEPYSKMLNCVYMHVTCDTSN